jgi:hypothetical protein
MAKKPEISGGGRERKSPMARKTRNAIVAAAGVGILALSAAIASAHITADPAREDLIATVINDDFDAAVPATPVSGVPLFEATQAAADRACMTGDEVVERLKADQDDIGGETVMLSNGLEQAFADTWRREVEAKPVVVTNVIAHIFDDANGAGVVDVIEFDATGCAMSRTILSVEDWDAILTDAAGYEV